MNILHSFACKLIFAYHNLKASLNTFADYEICYGNRFHIASMSGYNIKSYGFKVSGIGGIVYLTDLPYAEGKSGSINLFRLNSPTQPEIVKRNMNILDGVLIIVDIKHIKHHMKK